jgi:uncharacterized Zn finger protein
MNYLLCCQQCGEVVVKDSGSEAKIRSRVIVMKGGNAYAVCKGCGVEVSVPLTLDHEMMKSLHGKPKLFITKK